MIYEYLHEGKENAITSRELCALLNITGRDVTAAVERERREGKPICASTGTNPGYYLAADRETMESYCKSLHHREKEIARTRRACIKTIARLPGKEAV